MRQDQCIIFYSALCTPAFWPQKGLHETVHLTDPLQKSSDKQQSGVPEIPYQFADPCPASMRDVNIADLSAVDINWKMLTLARPKTKVDEEIFSKWVTKYREPEIQQNARLFGSSMAERQRFGCLDTWPGNCIQITLGSNFLYCSFYWDHFLWL